MNTDKNEPKVCPLCGRTYTEVPALSRKDNTMLICPDCGTRESLEAIGISPEEQEKVLEIIHEKLGEKPVEESDIDFSYELPHKNEDIKSTRKNLQKMKSGSLPKVLSRNMIEPNCKMYKEDMKIDYESEKDDSSDFKDDENYINNDNLLLYDENDFINYKIGENDKDKNKDEGEHNVRTNRINSCSILDVLKTRFSFDEPL